MLTFDEAHGRERTEGKEAVANRLVQVIDALKRLLESRGAPGFRQPIKCRQLGLVSIQRFSRE